MSAWTVSRALLVGAAAFVNGSIGALEMSGSAQATTYDLDIHCGSSVCKTFTKVGTVDITGGGTSLTYNFSLTSGSFWDGGQSTVFMSVGGTIVGKPTFTDNSAASVTWASTLAPKTDGLSGTTPSGEAGWDFGYDCKRNGATSCGTKFSVTFTGSGLVADFMFDPKNTTKNQVFAGLDLTCAVGSACPKGINFDDATGVVGATLAVPGPIAGTGLPCLVAACSGLLVLARRRRNSFA